MRAFFKSAGDIGKLLPSTSSSTQAVSPTSGDTSKKVVKHALVITHVNDSSSKLIDFDTHASYLRKSESLFGTGERPSPDTEPSAEQLSCLRVILDSCSVPYVDFAIFGPHATRMQRKMKFVLLLMKKKESVQKT